jgi:hypothetical protein
METKQHLMKLAVFSSAILFLLIALSITKATSPSLTVLLGLMGGLLLYALPPVKRWFRRVPSNLPQTPRAAFVWSSRFFIAVVGFQVLLTSMLVQPGRDYRYEARLLTPTVLITVVVLAALVDEQE